MWQINPARKREIWYLDVPFLKLFKRKIYRVVYWDINSYTGLIWNLKEDRIVEPDFTNLYRLLNNGWRCL